MRALKAVTFLAGLMLAVPATADTYKLDNLHTSLGFDIGHFGISRVIGRFNTVAGTFDLADDGTLSNINLTIDVNSVDTKVKQRDDHLRTADFFNVAEFPTITFVSESVTKLKGDKYEVVGKVTMMNVTKTLTAVVKHNGTVTDPNNGSVRQGASVSFQVKRSDWGMSGFLDTISDDVNVVLHVEAVKG